MVYLWISIISQYNDDDNDVGNDKKVEIPGFLYSSLSGLGWMGEQVKGSSSNCSIERIVYY